MRRFLITVDGVTDYDPEIHLGITNLFIFWEDGGDGQGLLVIADIESTRVRTKPELRQIAGRKGVRMPENNPDGVGLCVVNKVMDWESIGFGVRTPERLKPMINRALGLEEVGAGEAEDP